MKATAKDWDDVRGAFATSIMVDTALSSLAQNLDGPDWPIKGKDETPAKYIDLNFEEAIELLQLKGQKPDRLEQLIGILKDTLAFDSPFGEMVEQTKAAEERDNPLLKNLTKLGIPQDFPMNLTALEAGTLEFCKLEKLATLGEFAVFAQTMSQNVIVGGDFKKLLNALSHVDETVLAEVLPFRRGAKGLHLVEALAQATRSNSPVERAASAVNWFKDEFGSICAGLSVGETLDRHLMILANKELEQKVSQLLVPHFGPKIAQLKSVIASREASEKKSGFFGRLFGKK